MTGFGELVRALDATLPQTQCMRCGYPDCRAYAEAMAGDEADINQCPPGGAEGVARLAALTGRAAKPLNEAHGLEGPLQLAVIDEAWCIGCTLCLAACPADAILGGTKAMHTVIAAECTGCELCLPACPVDCISMAPVSGTHTGWRAWSPAQADRARERYAEHTERLARNAREHDERLAASAPVRRSTAAGPGPAGETELAGAAAPGAAPPSTPARSRDAVIQAALERARAARGS